MAYNNHINSTRIVVIIAFVILVFMCFQFASMNMASTTSFADTLSAIPFEMRADATNRTRVLVSNMLAMPSLAGEFEFYTRSITGNRTSIACGPWSGNLQGNLVTGYNRFYMQGTDSASGARYALGCTGNASETLTLTFTFTAPKMGGNLSFEIFSLSGDLFKNTLIAASPAGVLDSSIIPLEPLPVANRFLLKKKHRVIVRSGICDVEVTDLKGSNSINVADFRSVDWSRTKGIYFYSDPSSLSPGRTYTYSYAIRFLRDSAAADEAVSRMTATAAVDNGAQHESSESDYNNVYEFFSTQPKQLTASPEVFTIGPTRKIYCSLQDFSQKLADGIFRITSIRTQVSSSFTNSGIVITSSSREGKGCELPPEGYELTITPTSVTVRGADDRGCLYGVYALLGRIRYQNGTWNIPCGTVRDWPGIGIRAVCLELINPAIHDVEIFKRYLDALSLARANTVIFYHYPQQLVGWLGRPDPKGWSPEEIAEIANYAKSLRMDVWGGMVVQLPQNRFPQIEIYKGSNFYNPFQEESYNFLFSLYEKIINTYHPSTMLIGHDEISGLSSYAAAERISPADVFAGDVVRIHDWLRGRNVSTAMWGDMMLSSSQGALFEPANSSKRNSGETYLAIDRLPRDIQILDWHYGVQSHYPSIKYFTEKGFKVIGCSWYEPHNAKAMAESVAMYGAQGVAATDWGFWATLSPSATNMYSTLTAWSSSFAPDNGNKDLATLAFILRNSFATGKEKQLTVDLNGVANQSTWDNAPGSGKGVFDLGPTLDLRNLPSGTHKQSGVTSLVMPASRGAVANSLVVGHSVDGTVRPANDVKIPVNNRANKIAFIHTCYIDEPLFGIKKIGSYSVVYTDGTTELVDLLEGWNITDVRSYSGLRKNIWSFNRGADILGGSDVFWRGFSLISTPLNIQQFVWTNPHPQKTISHIVVNSLFTERFQRIALLGLTLLQ